MAPTNLGQRDNYCRACRAAYKQEHYLLHRQRYIDNAQRRKRSLAAERAAYLITFFEAHPCVDCGERDPLVLEFDHRGDKLFNISQGLRDRAWDAVLEEMEKCTSYVPTVTAGGPLAVVDTRVRLPIRLGREALLGESSDPFRASAACGDRPAPGRRLGS